MDALDILGRVFGRSGDAKHVTSSSLWTLRSCAEERGVLRRYRLAKATRSKRWRGAMSSRLAVVGGPGCGGDASAESMVLGFQATPSKEKQSLGSVSNLAQGGCGPNLAKPPGAPDFLLRPWAEHCPCAAVAARAMAGTASTNMRIAQSLPSNMELSGDTSGRSGSADVLESGSFGMVYQAQAVENTRYKELRHPNAVEKRRLCHSRRASPLLASDVVRQLSAT